MQQVNKFSVWQFLMNAVNGGNTQSCMTAPPPADGEEISFGYNGVRSSATLLESITALSKK